MARVSRDMGQKPRSSRWIERTEHTAAKQRLQILAQLKPLAEQVHQQKNRSLLCEETVTQQEKQAQHHKEQQNLAMNQSKGLKEEIQKHSICQVQEVQLVRGENLLVPMADVEKRESSS